MKQCNATGLKERFNTIIRLREGVDTLKRVRDFARTVDDESPTADIGIHTYGAGGLSICLDVDQLKMMAIHSLFRVEDILEEAERDFRKKIDQQCTCEECDTGKEARSND